MITVSYNPIRLVQIATTTIAPLAAREEEARRFFHPNPTIPTDVNAVRTFLSIDGVWSYSGRG